LVNQNPKQPGRRLIEVFEKGKPEYSAGYFLSGEGSWGKGEMISIPVIHVWPCHVTHVAFSKCPFTSAFLPLYLQYYTQPLTQENIKALPIRFFPKHLNNRFAFLLMTLA